MQGTSHRSKMVVILTVGLACMLSVGVLGITEAEEPKIQLVQGYFTEITIETQMETSIVLENDDVEYNWSYVDSEWSGDLNYTLEDRNEYIDGTWYLYIAVDHDVMTGQWDMLIDGDEYSVDVVEADETIKKIGTLNFLLEPHTVGATDDDSVTIRNSGNVRGGYEVIYDDMNLSSDHREGELEPGEEAEINFQYERDTTDLEKISPDVRYKIYSLDRLDTDADGNVLIGGERVLTGSGSVDVGYHGYERVMTDNYDIQYKENIEATGDTESGVTFFVYPRDDVFFNVGGINITDIDTDYEGIEIDSEYDEVKIEVTFRTHYENDGEVEFRIDGDVYTTTVDVDPVEPPETDDESQYLHDTRVRGGLIFLAILGLFVGVRHWKES